MGQLVAIDFDHTLVDHDKPLKGAKEAINILREKGHKIVIHSCNNRGWIERVLRNADIQFDYICGNDESKPACAIYIDDRGFRFTGDWTADLPQILEILDEQDREDG